MATRGKDRYDSRHDGNLASYEKEIDRLYRQIVSQAAAMGASLPDFNPDKIFSFDDYPALKRRAEKLLQKLRDGISSIVLNGIDAEWGLANEKNSELVRQVFGDNADKMSPSEYRKYFSNNDGAREAFAKRKSDGLGLSDRVWKYTEQFRDEIELGLDIGIRDGLSADDMSRALRQYLKYPDKLFRRVRDEHGVLQLSRRAAAFHPGRGVYRSSYKNARRLAATETNMAYRTADWLRWQQFDFVVGIEVRLSNNHPVSDICDDLKGRYPKDFKFTGWHPLCRCYAVSVLKTDEEMAEDTRKILTGEQTDGESVNRVDDVPPGFKKWIEDNSDRIARAKSLPYFIRDNEKYIPQVNVTDAALKGARASQRVNDEIMKAARPTRIRLTDEQKAHRKELQKEAIAKFKGVIVDNERPIIISASGIKEFLNQPHERYFEKNELVRELPSIIKKSKYIKELPYVKDNKYIKASHIYALHIWNKASYLIVRETKNGECYFYSISDSLDI